MNIDDFLSALTDARDQFRWFVDAAPGWEKIRGRLHGAQNCPCCWLDFCPITAVVRVRKEVSYGATHAHTAGQSLGLHTDALRAIISAADDEDADPPLRRRLEAALGLSTR